MANSERESVVIPDQLRKARESLALREDEIAIRLGVTPDDIVNWERGLSQPAVDFLWKLAEEYNRDISYFVRTTEALPEKLGFRVANRPSFADLSLDARKVIARFDELCRAQTELEKLLGKTPVVKVKVVRGDLTPEELCNRERERLGVNSKPVRDLRGMLVGQGLKIFELQVAGNEFSGLSWWHKEYGPCVLINAGDERGRRTFTLAHEYAHLLRDTPSLCDLTLDIYEERLASRFAALFLMPEADVQSEFRRRALEEGAISDAQLGSLAARYGVSLEAMGRRLEGLSLMPKGFTDSRIDEWKKRPGHPWPPKKPRWWRERGDSYVTGALQAYSEGRISIGRLAHLLGIDVWKADEEARRSVAKAERGKV